MNFCNTYFWGSVPKEICNNNGIYTPDLKFGILPENQRLEDEFRFWVSAYFQEQTLSLGCIHSKFLGVYMLGCPPSQ